MESVAMKYPFEASFAEIVSTPGPYVDSIFSSLESEFLVLPKGAGFIEYPVFEQGYEALKQATVGFTELSPDSIYKTTLDLPIALVVLRAMLGFTPPEWAYVTARRSGLEIPQGFSRTLDREIRLMPIKPIKPSAQKRERMQAMIKVACQVLADGAPKVGKGFIHRIDKADTRSGTKGLQSLASLGVPYAMVLYERFLGRPFAGHRDSVSELVGDVLETAIETVLNNSGISYRKTKRAERIEGLDQAPDFIVPDEFSPKVLIEAKITEDDGTARDKVTRIQHLGELSLAGQPKGRPKFEVIACLAGRGFGVRREDMKKVLLATRGKVFTLKTLHRLVECSKLSSFKTK